MRVVHIGDMKLDLYMQQNDMTDAELAKKIGVSQTTVLRWRKRETSPLWTMIPAIHEATGGQVGAADFVPDATVPDVCSSKHIGE